MRDTGFEPVQALSHESLNLAHLTTLALPHNQTIKTWIKKISKYIFPIFDYLSKIIKLAPRDSKHEPF